MSFQIDKGVEIPKKLPEPDEEAVNALQGMEVGDSFAFDKEAKKGVKAATRAVLAATGGVVKFRIKQTGDDLFRVWRTK